MEQPQQEQKKTWGRNNLPQHQSLPIGNSADTTRASTHPVHHSVPLGRGLAAAVAVTEGTVTQIMTIIPLHNNNNLHSNHSPPPLQSCPLSSHLWAVQEEEVQQLQALPHGLGVGQCEQGQELGQEGLLEQPLALGPSLVCHVAQHSQDLWEGQEGAVNAPWHIPERPGRAPNHSPCHGVVEWFGLERA